MADSGGRQVVHHTLSAPGFGTDMLSVLNDMRAEGVLLDVTVVAGEEEFVAHSTVLAYGSDYFRRLFASGMKETQDKRVELKDPSISTDGFRLLLNFLYTGKLVVTAETVYEVLFVANHLQVLPVVKLCCEFISQNMRDAPLELANYTRAQKVADMYGLTTLQEKVDSALSENFLELSTSGEFLESTTADQLVKLLQTNKLVSPSELQVYEAVVRWLMYDQQTRIPHAADVLSHVRFALLDQSTLYGLLQTDLGLEETCRHLILEAMAYHSFSPEIKRGMVWPRSKPRSSTERKVLLAFTSSKVWAFSANGWMVEELARPPEPLGPTQATPMGAFIPAAPVVGRGLFGSSPKTPEPIQAAVVVGNALYAMIKSCFKFYDPTTNTWKDLPSPPDPGYHGSPKMTAMGGKLYAVQAKVATNFGQVTSDTNTNSNKAYCYDLSKGRWMKLPSFPRPSDGVTLVSCQGTVFAIGGYVQLQGADHEPTSTVQTFYPPNNSWEAVSPTVRPHAGATAMVQGDIIYIAGGKTFRDGKILGNATVEMCRAGLMVSMKASPWSVVPQPLSVHKFATQVAVIDRKAYFILGGQMHFTGKFIDDDRTSVEDVEDMCQSFRKGLETYDVVCATLALAEGNEN